MTGQVGRMYVIEGLNLTGKTTVANGLIKISDLSLEELIDSSKIQLAGRDQVDMNDPCRKDEYYWRVNEYVSHTCSDIVKSGRSVFVVRYFGSTMAALSANALKNIEQILTERRKEIEALRMPDMTFYLTATPEEIRSRVSGKNLSREDKRQINDQEWAQRLREAYEFLAGIYTWVTIDTTGKDITSVVEEIHGHILMQHH